MYKVFNSRRDNLLDALGLDILRSSRSNGRFREFWALRGISFELARGQRIGIIGRNGAGKSTLLKIVTGNLPHSEGHVEVNGDVQALLEIGGGLHPEFTGYENIQAALSFLGLSTREIRAAVDDIAEFTELGRFLNQPFRTYSLGMQARLSIGIATTIQPEILIIDEILGAGDAYFFAKSSARMQKLLDSGAAVLLVTHSLEQIQRFCDETMWIERGRVVMHGPTTEVIKAYERFIRQLDDRRLQAKNRKAVGYDAFDRESYTDHLGMRLSVDAGGACDITRVALLRDGLVEDEIAVGDAQDADGGQSSHVILDASDWSGPRREGDAFFRTVAAENRSAAGTLLFYLWFFYSDSQYEFELTYRASASVTVFAERAGRVERAGVLPASDAFTTLRLVAGSPLRPERTIDRGSDGPESDSDDEGHEANDRRPVQRLKTSVSRWSGGGELLITHVGMLDGSEIEQTVFEVHRPLRVRIDIVAHESGVYPLILAALVFRADGVIAMRHVSKPISLEMNRGDRVSAELSLEDLLLGNGDYRLSLGLYRKLDLNDLEPSEFYDYFDRSFEFRVVGNPALHNEIVRHPGNWSIGTPTQAAQDAAEPRQTTTALS
ncbi:MAG TPA: ABC transporter ATP-binding protein [Gaiellaceae bacterium]